MKILVGDETGLIKYVSYEESKVLSRFGIQANENQINFLEYLDEENEEDILTFSRQNVIKLFKMDKKSNFLEVCSSNLDLDLNYKDLTVGFNRVVNTTKIILGSNKGQIFKTEFNPDETKFLEVENLINLPFENIKKMKLSPFESKHFMILSKDTNPQIFDIENKKIVWKARNVKNDYLDLKVPIHDLDVAFSPNNKNAYVSTAYNKIRIYDLAKTNSQPIFDFQPNYEESPFNNILLSPCANFLYVSNHIGSIFQLDLRKDLGLVSKMKGALGTIKSMALHKTSPYLGVVGSDRYLRIYNLMLKKMTFKMHLKQKLSSLLFNKEGMLKDVEVSEEDDIEAFKPMEKQQLSLPKKIKKQTIKLSYLKEEEKKENELEECFIPKKKKKIKK